MPISHQFPFLEVLFLSCLLTNGDLVLMLPCTVQFYSVMHVHFTVCWFDNLYCESKLKLILISIIRGKAITSNLNCIVVYITLIGERHFMEFTIQSSKQNHNL